VDLAKVFRSKDRKGSLNVLAWAASLKVAYAFKMDDTGKPVPVPLRRV
jgi:hypothetical protein